MSQAMGVAVKLSNAARVPAAAEGCLDLDHLDRATFGDRTLQAEVVGLLLSQLSSSRQTLLMPLDAQGWHYLTHTLKGAASAVGASEIASLAVAWGRLSPPATQSERLDLCQTLDAASLRLKAASRHLGHNS